LRPDASSFLMAALPLRSCRNSLSICNRSVSSPSPTMACCSQTFSKKVFGPDSEVTVASSGGFVFLERGQVPDARQPQAVDVPPHQNFSPLPVAILDRVQDASMLVPGEVRPVAKPAGRLPPQLEEAVEV